MQPQGARPAAGSIGLGDGSTQGEPRGTLTLTLQAVSHPTASSCASWGQRWGHWQIESVSILAAPISWSSPQTEVRSRLSGQDLGTGPWPLSAGLPCCFLWATPCMCPRAISVPFPRGQQGVLPSSTEPQLVRHSPFLPATASAHSALLVTLQAPCPETATVGQSGPSSPGTVPVCQKGRGQHRVGPDNPGVFTGRRSWSSRGCGAVCA